MELETLTRFDAGSMEKGVDDFPRDFQPHTELTEESVNVSYGMAEGWSPRAGIAPVPGFSEAYTNTPGGTWNPDFASFLSAVAGGKAVTCLGHAQFTAAYEADTAKIYHVYFVKISSTTCGFFTPWVPGKGNQIPSPTVGGALDFQATVTQWSRYVGRATIRTIASSLAGDFARMAVLAIRGGRIATPSVVATNVSGRECRHGSFGGIPEFGTVNFPSPPPNRVIRALRIDSFGVSGKDDTWNSISPYGATRVYTKAQLLAAGTDIDLDPFAPDSTIGAGDGAFTLVQDSELKIDVDYKIVAAVYANRAFLGIAQWALYHNANTLAQIEPSGWFVPNVSTRVYTHTTPGPPPDTISEPYREDNNPKQTCWVFWRRQSGGADGYTKSSNLEGTETSAQIYYSPVKFGAAGTGILKSGITYEFTYSFYNKLLNIETNVGTPARATPAVDLVGIRLFRQKSAVIGTGKAGIHADTSLPFQTPPRGNLNHYDIRVYYRPLGTFEWLPGGSVACSEIFWNAKLKLPTAPGSALEADFSLYFCTGTDVGTLGGQPGGFNDYSPLPNDNWIDVVAFQDRLFWFSASQFIYSMRSKPIVYPNRNSVPLPSGQCRGGIVHTFPGQASQDARLVVFGASEMYVGLFKGAGFGIQQSVQVSQTSVATFELEGSDFILQRRSSFTAYSSRAAVVADGILFFWGPQGVCADNGNDLPERISKELDLLIPTLFNGAQADKIHAVYDAIQREVKWFYPPASGTGTGMLCLSLRTKEFYLGSIAADVKWSADVTVETDDIKELCGNRTMVGVAAIGGSNTYPFFMDHKVRGGDWFPGREMAISAIATSGSYKRLTLTTALMTSIDVGDRVVMPNPNQYAGSAAGITACKGIVKAKDNAAKWIDVEFTTTVPNYTAADFTKRIPLYTDDIHSFLWVLETQLWCPGGLKFWWRWLYAYTLWRVGLLPAATGPSVTFEHRTPQSGNYVSRTITLTDNSRGSCQIHSQMVNTNMAAEGQALQVRFSGSHNGDEWTLQDFAVEAEPMEAGSIRMFEG
jgi:hypothetical protein